MINPKAPFISSTTRPQTGVRSAAQGVNVIALVVSCFELQRPQGHTLFDTSRQTAIMPQHTHTPRHLAAALRM